MKQVAELLKIDRKINQNRKGANRGNARRGETAREVKRKGKPPERRKSHTDDSLYPKLPGEIVHEDSVLKKIVV